MTTQEHLLALHAGTPGYCPISGFIIYDNTVRSYTDQEKRKKRKAYHEKKQQASVVLATYDNEHNLTLVQ